MCIVICLEVPLPSSSSPPVTGMPCPFHVLYVTLTALCMLWKMNTCIIALFHDSVACALRMPMSAAWMVISPVLKPATHVRNGIPLVVLMVMSYVTWTLHRHPWVLDATSGIVMLIHCSEAAVRCLHLSFVLLFPLHVVACAIVFWGHCHRSAYASRKLNRKQWIH